MKPLIRIAALFAVCNEIRRSAGIARIAENAGIAGNAGIARIAENAGSAGTHGSAENAVCADSGRECRERLETRAKWTE
jgi:hypothetical protein